MQTENNAPKNENQPQRDSLGISLKKSPWLLFAVLQIPIVIGMLILIYFMYQNAGGGNQ